jgi:hypothetical protein
MMVWFFGEGISGQCSGSWKLHISGFPNASTLCFVVIIGRVPGGIEPGTTGWWPQGPLGEGVKLCKDLSTLTSVDIDMSDLRKAELVFVGFVTTDTMRRHRVLTDDHFWLWTQLV